MTSKDNPNYLRWVVEYIMQHPVISSIVYFTSLVEPLFYMYPLFISANIVDILYNGGGFDEVWKNLFILIPIAIFQVVLFFISSFLNEVLAHRITTDVTYDLFKDMQKRSLAYHDSKDTGKTMTLAMNDTRALNQFLSPGIRMILAAVTIFIVTGIILNSIDELLVFFYSISIIIFTILVFRYRKKVGPLSTRVLEELSDISSITSDTLTNMYDIKSYNAESLFKNKFRRKAMKQAISKELEGRAGTVFWPSLVTIFATVSMISYTIYLLSHGRVTYRDLVLVTTSLGLFSGFSSEFKWVSFLMSAGIASALRLNEFMFEPDIEPVGSGDRIFHNIDASIEFNDVSFGFDVRDENGKVVGFNQVLHNISFKINDGETVAIVGGPGSGKSSIIKLIQRLYKPMSGEILIGAYGIGEFDNSSLRREMATVEQEVFLFNESLLDNIRFARPDATEEEVIHASKVAQAHDFISSFEEGYNTEIGDNGVRLSGGQAQRIAIARALIIDPQILILDDGASALDARTELQIQQAISEILRTRTTVITTHRLAIIAKADHVLILDKGRVVGFDTHEKLILTNIFYRRFFERHYDLPDMEVS